MHLDLRTLAFVIVLIQALYSIGLFLISRSWIKSHGLNLVAFAMGLGAIGWALIMLRHLIHPFFSIVVANVLTLSGHVVTVEAILRLRSTNSKTRFMGYTLVVLTLPINLYLTFIYPDLPSRIIVMSLFIGAVSLNSAYLLLRDIDKKLAIPIYSSSFFFFFATIMMLVRIAWALTHGGFSDFMASDFGLCLIQLSYVVYLTGITFSLIWLSTQTLGLELIAAQISIKAGFEDNLNAMDILSHKLKTPVATIVNSLESLQLRLVAPDPAIQKVLDRISRSTRNLANIVETILNKQNSVTEKPQNKTSRVYIADLLETVVRMGYESFPQRIIKIKYQGRDLALSYIAGDKNRLLTAFDNVLENALKFSAPDKDVLISAVRVKQKLLVSITDKGCGVNRDDRGELFDKYFRGTNIGKVPGTGVGLFLVKQIISAHGGDIKITNREAGGCRVDIYLPFK